MTDSFVYPGDLFNVTNDSAFPQDPILNANVALMKWDKVVT